MMYICVRTCVYTIFTLKQVMYRAICGLSNKLLVFIRVTSVGAETVSLIIIHKLSRYPDRY